MPSYDDVLNKTIGVIVFLVSVFLAVVFERGIMLWISGMMMLVAVGFLFSVPVNIKFVQGKDPRLEIDFGPVTRLTQRVIKSFDLSKRR